MKRLVEFIRSVIPADPAQLLFLAGVVCLTVAPRLQLWPSGLVAAGDHRAESLAEQDRARFAFFVWPIVFSGIAGYFVCFRPGSRPLRRILGLVFAPATAGLALIFFQLLSFKQATSSVLQTTGHAARPGWFPDLWNLPAGIDFCLAGLFLAATYTSRLAFGIAQLPLSLRRAPASEAAESESWRHLQFFIWVLIGPLFLLSSLWAFVTILLPMMITSRLPGFIQSEWFTRLSPVGEALFLFLILFWIMGREDRQTVRDSAQLPEPRYVALGLAFPIGVAVCLSTGQYLVDRALWAAHEFWKFSPPRFRSYFDFPDPWLLLLLFPALFEEMIFRGLLQRRFVQRYGIYRGIFLVGIVWAAFHFVSDVSFGRSRGANVLLLLGFRILNCLALSYVFGWLTIQFNSIIPAAAAHTLHNVLVFSGFGPPFFGKETLRVALWAVLAWVLFRYWPVCSEDSSGPAPTIANAESAA